MPDTFPTDPVTLAALRAACECDHDRSHLHDFLDFGAVEASRIELEPGVVQITYKPGREPWSPNQVIVALCDEIERLRLTNVDLTVCPIAPHVPRCSFCDEPHPESGNHKPTCSWWRAYREFHGWNSDA